jgi:hypothetical protein
MKVLANVRDQLERRSLFWTESFLAVVSMSLAALTLLIPDWIEVALRIDPDGGKGNLEWLLVFSFTGIGLLMLALARRSRAALLRNRS